MPPSFCAALYLTQALRPCIKLKMQKRTSVRAFRELGAAISTIAAEQIRPIQLEDFRCALTQSKPSVNRKQLENFERWTEEFGTKG